MVAVREVAWTGGVRLSYKDQQEEILIQKAKELDPDAWAKIYNCYYRRIYTYPCYKVGRRDSVEDLAATVFLEAMEGIDKSPTGAYHYQCRKCQG